MLASLISPEPDGSLIVMKFWLIVSGIYIWEFITTLDFEWRVIRRHQRYQWTIWIYSVSRLSGLGVIILVLVDFYNTSPINCQAWVTCGWICAITGCGLSSILIMLRIFAIWDKSKVIMAISAAIWIINIGFQLAGVVKIRAAWVPVARSCAITNLEICRNLYINWLITDVVLLSIMLAGLLRFRRVTAGSVYLSRVLWKQGVIWLVIATAVELPQVLLLCLHVNDSLHSLVLVPSVVALIIAATRTYRSLIHSADCPFVDPDSPSFPRRLVSRTTNDTAVTHTSNRLEVTVHTSYDHGEYPTTQMNHSGSHSDDSDKPYDLGSDDNVEGGDE